MKRYDDCPFENSECRKCSLSNYEMDCHNNPAQKLGYWMAVKKITQKAIEANAGITQQAISKFITGERDIGNASARTVSKIAGVLGVTVEDLIDG